MLLAAWHSKMNTGAPHTCPHRKEDGQGAKPPLLWNLKGSLAFPVSLAWLPVGTSHSLSISGRLKIQNSETTVH